MAAYIPSLMVVLLSSFVYSTAIYATAALASLTKKGFVSTILINGEPGFSNSTEPFAFNYARNPKVALLPSSADEVSTAIKVLNLFNIDFAIRSGGVADSQSEDVIISLQKLNKVEYDSSMNVIHLGPGQSWGDVYNAMRNLSVTALGGRIPLVGVGGFTVGGGVSYLMNSAGLASDSIVDAQVVLADGSIKWASTDPDLFFAVKGAGYTIGAVTEFIVKAYPKPRDIFAGFVAFPIEQLDAITKNVVDFIETNADPNVALLLSVASLSGTPVVVVNPYVFGSTEFAKSALPWVWELPDVLLDTTASLTWEELQNIQLQFVHHPAENSNYQQHNVVIESVTTKVIKSVVEWQLGLLSDPRWSGVQILFEPFIPGAFSEHVTLGSWPHASRNMSLIEIFIEQQNATVGDPEINEAKLREGAEVLKQAAGAGSVLPAYPNYYLQTSNASDYYGDNLPKLQSVKLKFDPKNRFNKKIPIRPAE